MGYVEKPTKYRACPILKIEETTKTFATCSEIFDELALLCVTNKNYDPLMLLSNGVNNRVEITMFPFGFAEEICGTFATSPMLHWYEYEIGCNKILVCKYNKY